MTLINTLAYYGTELITTVTSFIVQTISAGREPKICLGWIFNTKLDSFAPKTLMIQPILELKTPPKFSPVIQSLSIVTGKMIAQV